MTPHGRRAGTVAVTVSDAPRRHADLRATRSADAEAASQTTCTSPNRSLGRRTTEAVRGVAFDIADKPGVGEIVVFLGPSGCGKSTILKAVAGLLPPTTRRGRSSTASASNGVGRDRGMVFQAYTSFGWLTVRENVEYGLQAAGRAESASAASAGGASTSKRSGSHDSRDQYPQELSGGMKQRVAIARTLINSPKLVLMDEPFGALDPQTRWGMQGLLLDISRNEDNTILFVTHDVSEAVYLADTVFVLVEAAGADPAPRRRAVLRRARHLAEVDQRVPDGREAAARSALLAVGMMATCGTRRSLPALAARPATGRRSNARPWP